MLKRKLISRLASIHDLYNLKGGAGHATANRELCRIIDTLESELVYDDSSVFRGVDCTDLIEEYHRGYLDFGMFLKLVRQRGGGDIAELKEFAEPFRVKEVA